MKNLFVVKSVMEIQLRCNTVTPKMEPSYNKLIKKDNDTPNKNT